jgi:hypothetical protein
MIEARVELLLGMRVLDANGRRVGRIEEIRAEERGGELLVTDYLVGGFGLAKRLSIARFAAGFLRLFGAYGGSANVKKIPWEKLDLSDPEHPRTTCPVEELQVDG